MQSHILSIILFTPLAGAILLIFIPKEQKDAIRWIANIFALAGLLVSIPLVPWFWAQRLEPGFKFMEGTPNNWIPSIGAGYVPGCVVHEDTCTRNDECPKGFCAAAGFCSHECETDSDCPCGSVCVAVLLASCSPLAPGKWPYRLSKLRFSK